MTVHNVRNFYLTADIDGRASGLSGGPRSKDGGMSATILVRHEGSILRAVEISAIARRDGTLLLRVTPTSDAGRKAEVETEPGTFRDAAPGFTITTKR
jgi:hypothetical protein